MYQPNYYMLTFLIRSARANRSSKAPIFARISVSGQSIASHCDNIALPSHLSVVYIAENRN